MPRTTTSSARAADLAHGLKTPLKTPLAALAADAGRLRERGETKFAGDIEAVGSAMSRHVDRELAPATVRGESRRGNDDATNLMMLTRSLSAIVSRTPAGVRIAFESRIAETARRRRSTAPKYPDNATRHAKSRIRISAERGSNGVPVIVEVDDEGSAPEARTAADTRHPARSTWHRRRAWAGDCAGRA